MDAKALRALLLALVLALLPGVGLDGDRTAEAAVPTERQIRALETRMLGAEHAAEHASARRAARRGRKVRHAHAHARARTGTRARARARVKGKRRPVRGRVRARKADASTDGLWARQFDVPGVAISVAMLPTNKLIYFDDVRSMVDPNHPGNTARAHIYDLATGAIKTVNPPPDAQGRPINIWCSGISFLLDGRLLVTGGNLGYTDDRGYMGLQTVFTFDPFTERWTRHADMRHGRWYPGQAMLADGRTIILDGEDEFGDTNQEIEMFDPATNSLSFLGTRGTGGDMPTTGGWYPRTFLMPSGRGLVAGPNAGDSWFFWLEGSRFKSLEAPNSRYRTYGGVVLLPGGPDGSTRVLATGGLRDSNTPADATTEIFDEARAAWQSAPDMKLARGHHNVVTLPDGTLVSIGGGLGKLDGDSYAFSATAEQRTTEIYDPRTGEWTLGPAQQEHRTYHSTAALLPDGRVLSGGDDRPGHKEADTFEIYEPAYLHKGGERPVIQSAPTALDYRQGFAIATSGPAASRAVLMAPASNTHGFDTNQRHVELRLTRRAGGADVIAPPSANVAPPGYYMLFVLDERGVPSVAKWVKVGGWAPALNTSPPGSATPPASTPKATGAPARGAATVARPGRLGTVVRRGLRVRVSCPAACSASLKLRVSAATARRLRRTTLVGMGRSRLRRAGSATVALRPDAAVRRPLGRLRRVSLIVEATIKVDGGATVRTRKTVSVRR